MGVVVYLLWSFSFFMNFAGERLELEKAVPRYRRPGRPISVLAVPFGLALIFGVCVGFLGRFFALCELLLVGLAGRLRHIGWEKCGHGLTSMLRRIF